nr:PTS sugar transporter subunit IIA [Liquorilactobacillus satsumensis]
MADVFNRKYIFLEKELPDQQAVFRFIAKQAVALQLAKKEQLVLKALEKREAEMSTGGCRTNCNPTCYFKRHSASSSVIRQNN